MMKRRESESARAVMVSCRRSSLLCVMEQNCSSAQISPSLSRWPVSLCSSSGTKREMAMSQFTTHEISSRASASPAFQPARDQGGYLISKTVARALTRALLCTGEKAAREMARAFLPHGARASKRERTTSCQLLQQSFVCWPFWSSDKIDILNSSQLWIKNINR